MGIFEPGIHNNKMLVDKKFRKNVLASLVATFIFTAITYILGLFDLDKPFEQKFYNIIVVAIYFVALAFTIFVFTAKKQSIVDSTRLLPKYNKKTKLVSSLVLAMYTILLILLMLFSKPGFTNKGISPDDSDFIKIMNVDLIDKQEGDYWHRDEFLYTFTLKGKMRFNGNPRKYSILIFYKNFGHPDQKYGWFCVEALGHNGFEHPNTLALDELDYDAWEYHTSRVYIEKKYKPHIGFIAFILPSDLNLLKGTYLTRNHGGWGWESLNFLKDRENVLYSEVSYYY